MSADLPVIPYPAESRFKSWREEHAAQVSVMAQQAGRRRTIMLGDLNTGPVSPGLDGELAENFPALAAAGYVDPWTSGQQCTYCQDNPLVCSRPDGCAGGLNSRLDHILMKNFESGLDVQFERINEREISIVDGDGRTHATRLSDHYGLMATMPY